MERSRYGEERRVKRVRISSSAYLSSNDDDDDDETSIGASKRSPCQKNKTADSSVGTHQVVKVTKVVGKKALFEDDGSEKVAKKECSVAVRYTLTLCEECAHGDAADEMLLCDKCDRGFHMFCLSPILVTVPPGDWICPHCSQSTTALEFQMVQKRIVDYFSMQRFLPSNQEMEAREVKRQRGRPPSGPRLLPHVPTADVHRRLEQMASLAAALTSIGVDFCDSLNYGYAPRTANRAAHEKGGMRVLKRCFTNAVCPQPRVPVFAFAV